MEMFMKTQTLDVPFTRIGRQSALEVCERGAICAIGIHVDGMDAVGE